LDYNVNNNDREDFVRTRQQTGVSDNAAGLGAVSLAGCSGNGSSGDGGDSGSTSTESNTGSDTDTASSGSSGSGETLKIGYSNFTNGLPFEVMVRKAVEWYAADKDDIELLSTAGDGSTSQQISDCRNLLRQGIDGLIMTPADSNGMAVIAEEADVPVFSADIPVYSEQIGMHVGVDQMKYGRAGARALIEAMEQTWSDVDEYKFLEVQMTQDNSNSVLRSRAFNNVISESDVATATEKIVISGFAASEVASKVSS
jgi:ABC-type sugar transport system substrate-binding protein